MDTPKSVKWIFGLIVLAAACAATVWLSGFMFFVFNKVNPVGQTDFTTWWVYFEHYKDDQPVFKKLVGSLALSAAVCIGGPIIAAIAAMRTKRSLYGDARFATAAEVAKTGLYAEDGIIVGKLKGRYLVFPGQQFVLLAAPTRGGKGVGVVVPNLLHYRESVVVLDVKLENYYLTAGFRRKHGQKVFLFNPFSEDFLTARYNPMDYIRDDDFRISDLTAIGEVFYPTATGGTDGFFDDQARNLFIGLGLYLCETPSLPCTIGEMLRQSSGKGKPIKAHLEKIIETRNFKEVTIEGDGEAITKLVPRTEQDEGLPPLSEECIDALNRFVNTSDNTRSSILATFNGPLGIWSNPIVDAATSHSDFDLRRVRKERMSIYIGIKPDQLAVAGRLINLLFSQLINLNTKVLPEHDSSLKHQCLLIMDEFTAMGRVGIIAKANSFMAGYNLRLLTIIQSTAQLEAYPPTGYGKEDSRTLVTNHALQIIFPPRDQNDADLYSKMLGEETFKSTSTSKQIGKSQRSESMSDQRRSLMLPQELKEMGTDKEIICLENSKPIMCDKVVYYRDAVFIDRLKSVSTSLSAIKGLPTKKELDSAALNNELAPVPPRLDLGLHKAKVQDRVRDIEQSDISAGIDLNRIAINLNQIDDVADDKEELSEAEVNSFVDSFFASFDVVEPEELDDGDHYDLSLLD